MVKCWCLCSFPVTFIIPSGTFVNANGIDCVWIGDFTLNLDQIFPCCILITQIKENDVDGTH